MSGGRQGGQGISHRGRHATFQVAVHEYLTRADVYIFKKQKREYLTGADMLNSRWQNINSSQWQTCNVSSAEHEYLTMAEADMQHFKCQYMKISQGHASGRKRISVNSRFGRTVADF